MRRVFKRRPGGGGGGSGGGAFSQRPPLPTSVTVIEYWHSELQCTVPTWTGQAGGRVLPGINAPTVVVDPGFFNGRQIARCQTAGNRAWVGSGLVGLPAAGTRPWAMVIARIRTVAGTQQFFAAGTAITTESQLFVGAAFFGATFSVSGNLLSTVAADTAVHRIKAWRDGVNRHVVIDNTTTSSADVNSAIATDSIAIGCQANAAGGFADASVAFAIILSAKPTAAEEAALDAWARGYWASG